MVLVKIFTTLGTVTAAEPGNGHWLVAALLLPAMLLLGLSGPAEAAEPAQPDTVNGVVSDWDGSPLAGAAVDLFYRAANTDQQRADFIGAARTAEDGTFQFEVDRGCYVLTFVAPAGREYVTGQYLRAAACTSPSGTAVVDVQLLPGAGDLSASIGGKVLTADGSPARPAFVTIFAAAADGSRSTYLGATRSDQDDGGTFQFDVTPGCYVMDVRAPGGDRFNRGIWFQTSACVGAGETVDDLIATLDPRSTTLVTGNVRLGGPVAPGVVIDLFSECCEGNPGQGTRDEYLGSTQTNESGSYLFALPGGGCYILVYIAPEGSSFQGNRYFHRKLCPAEDEVLRAETTYIDSNATASVLSGKVYKSLDVNGNPRITLWNTNADGSRGTYLAQAVSDTGGEFSFRVGAGCYWLVFEASENTSFAGEPFQELSTCVDAFDQVDDLDVLLSDADGLSRLRAQLLIENNTVAEPDEGFVDVPVVVTIDHPWPQPVTVYYRVSGTRSENGPPNYVDTEGEAVFAPNQTELIIPVRILGDIVPEPEDQIIAVSLFEDLENNPYYSRLRFQVIDND